MDDAQTPNILLGITRRVIAPAVVRDVLRGTQLHQNADVVLHPEELPAEGSSVVTIVGLVSEPEYDAVIELQVLHVELLAGLSSSVDELARIVAAEDGENLVPHVSEVVQVDRVPGQLELDDEPMDLADEALVAMRVTLQLSFRAAE